MCVFGISIYIGINISGSQWCGCSNHVTIVFPFRIIIWSIAIFYIYDLVGYHQIHDTRRYVVGSFFVSDGFFSTRIQTSHTRYNHPKHRSDPHGSRWNRRRNSPHHRILLWEYTLPISILLPQIPRGEFLWSIRRNHLRILCVSLLFGFTLFSSQDLGVLCGHCDSGGSDGARIVG